MLSRHPPGLDHHRQSVPRAHGPPHNPSRIEIEQHSHGKPPGTRGHKGQIPRPHTILRRDGKLSVEAIGDDRCLLLAHLHGTDIPTPA
jgi:hypothetical protein